jgi:predicted dehydrogenase
MMTTLAEEGALEFVAFAEPYVNDLNRASYDKLISIGAKHYEDYQEMLKRHPEIDFVTICTPIPLHKPMSIYAMEQGFHVLTEKPPAVTIQDIDAMIETSRKTGKRCAVFFQMTSEKAFHLLNDKLRAGTIGDVVSVTGVGMWQRTDEYYQRTPWAGQLLHKGEYVLDGTINNPFAHLLNNCLIAAGSGDPGRAAPVRVQAELYRGHDIPAEDTSCVRIEAANGVEIRFYATLCHERSDTPYIIVRGSAGTIRWNYDGSLAITGRDGREEFIEIGKQDLHRAMYTNFIHSISDGQTEPFSPIASCRSFVLAANGAFESSRQTYPLPAESWKELPELFRRAAESGKLFSELGVPWGVATEPFDLKDYRQFRLYKSPENKNN